jgi:AspT/YidE/YbjL antiporter-like protein
MSWLHPLIFGDGVAGLVVALCLVAGTGIALGAVKFKGISFGIAGVLFAGILYAHLAWGAQAGAGPELAGLVERRKEILEFLRELGLILFVYSIGMQLGPGIGSSLRAQGLRLNLLAAAVVALGVATAFAIHATAGIDGATMVGLLSGAVTNTPGLAAAQQALKDFPDLDQARRLLPATGYAVAYPFGVLGVILSFIAIRLAFRLDPAQEARTVAGGESNADPLRLQFGDELVAEGAGTGPGRATVGNLAEKLASSQLVALAVGILAGVVIGSIPVAVPGLPAPLKLGLAGGPLVAALLCSRLGRVGRLDFSIPPSANLMLRELGLVLFLACVGLMAGDRFVATACTAEGLRWLAWAALITVVPVLAVAVFARLAYRLNLTVLMGLMAGSMTDPPALAYANATAGSDAPMVSYATVYPLVMILRVVTAQLFVLACC